MPVLRIRRAAAAAADRDRFQRKPGLFRLDECAGCGLVFQNPRLGSRGLNYYEGLGAEATERCYGRGKAASPAEVHSQPLVDTAHDMADRYGVITMHHYLEHTTDPEAEVAAAHRAGAAPSAT